jgi:hypothetical protein
MDRLEMKAMSERGRKTDNLGRGEKSGIGPPRRGRRAIKDREHQGFVRLEYLRNYDRDFRFNNALIEFYDRHWLPSRVWLIGAGDLYDVQYWDEDGIVGGEVRSFLEDLRRFAAQFGLDRLKPRIPEAASALAPSAGEALVFQWCQHRAGALRERRTWSPNRFSVGMGPILTDYASPSGRLDTSMCVEINDQWDPRDEDFGKARKRLRSLAHQKIERELDRVAVQAESKGYTFPDTKPKARRNLRWLYEHVALGMSYGDLAAKHLEGPDQSNTIYNNVKPYADIIGIPLGREASPV